MQVAVVFSYDNITANFKVVLHLLYNWACQKLTWSSIECCNNISAPCRVYGGKFSARSCSAYDIPVAESSASAVFHSSGAGGCKALGWFGHPQSMQPSQPRTGDVIEGKCGVAPVGTAAQIAGRRIAVPSFATQAPAAILLQRKPCRWAWPGLWTSAEPGCPAQLL